LPKARRPGNEERCSLLRNRVASVQPATTLSIGVLRMSPYTDTRIVSASRIVLAFSMWLTASTAMAQSIKGTRLETWGTWKSSEPSRLELGPLALTRAQCPPWSLHDRIVKHWPYLRSYVMKDGHLFLALMADGGIYEFEPRPAQLPSPTPET
jgi:hypothetical protein